MSSLEDSFETACKEETIPGAVLLATDKTGSFQYGKTFGVQSFGDDAKQPMRMDSVLWIASCTKLMTSIAVMQLIERGRITLEDDVSSVLPELASLEILTGFDESDKPQLKKRQNTITLRHLLTHTSGATYDQTSPLLLKYRIGKGEAPGSGGTIAERHGYPLLFEPGTDWVYGPSIDWAGLYMERITGESLEDYMAKNIWAPLGIKDITFWPNKRADMQDRLVGMTLRDPAGGVKVVPWAGESMQSAFAECYGGAGAVASMPDYMKILQSLLADDERLVKKETLAQMFSPQLTKEEAEGLNRIWSDPKGTKLFIGTFPSHIKYDWGIGGLITVEDTEGWRNKASMIWGGMANLFWIIDRTAGLACLYGSQVIPPGDAKSSDMITLFEKAMYERKAGAKAKI